VRRAVEELFNVKVEKIAVQNRLGKTSSKPHATHERAKPWKKAIVTLKPDNKINLF